MIVDGGNAPVFERITAKIATAAVNGTPKDQSLSPLEVSRQGGCEGLRYHLTRLLSWLYAPRTPKRTGERDQGEPTRCMYPAPSNLHSLIVLPLDLFERHPSKRGGMDQHTSTPKLLKGDSGGRDLTLLQTQGESPRKGSLVVGTWRSL